MNAATAARTTTDIAHKHRGDFYREADSQLDTVSRMRSHLRDASPDMDMNVRLVRIVGSSFARVSITRCEAADLSGRDAGFAARRRVDAELARFIRTNEANIDYSLHASMLGKDETGDRPDDAVALGSAVRRIGGRLKPWTDIMEALRTRTLTCWRDPVSTADTPWLRAILVRPADLAIFDAVPVRSANGTPHIPPENCSLTEARDILNLHGTLSVDLQEVFAGEIAQRPQWGPRKDVAMASVLQIAGTQISMAEMCARAGWNPRQAKWALGPYEHLRTACGWDRVGIENSGVLTERIDWRVRAHRRETRAVGSVRL